MSDLNNTNSMTAVQVKRKLKSIHTDNPDTKKSLLKLLEKFQCMDQIVKSTGLINGSFSFASRVSWDAVLSGLKNNETNDASALVDDVVESASQASSQLADDVIPRLQKMRNKWMFEVVFIEFVFFLLIGLAVASVMQMQGNLVLSEISLEMFLYERPIFSLLTGAVIFFSVLLIHFRIRSFVAKKLSRNISNELSEFDFAQAFLKNTRLQHSIFRPEIVGLSRLKKKCIQKRCE